LHHHAVRVKTVPQIQHAPAVLPEHPRHLRGQLCSVYGGAQVNLITARIRGGRNVWHNHPQLRINAAHIRIEQFAFVLVACEIRIHMCFVLTQRHLQLFAHGVQVACIHTGRVKSGVSGSACHQGRYFAYQQTLHWRWSQWSVLFGIVTTVTPWHVRWTGQVGGKDMVRPHVRVYCRGVPVHRVLIYQTRTFLHAAESEAHFRATFSCESSQHVALCAAKPAFLRRAESTFGWAKPPRGRCTRGCLQSRTEGACRGSWARAGARCCWRF